MTHYIDLSHLVENGMTCYPGDPEPRIVPAESTPPWRVSELHVGTHTGTHIDAASHFIPDGKTITDYLPARFLLPGIVVPLTRHEEDAPISADELRPHLANAPRQGALALHTAWDIHWKTERYLLHPHLTREAAHLIVASGISIVGIDALNVDSTAQGTDYAHDILLGHDVLIVENLTGLQQLRPGIVYQFSFLPLALSRLDGSPIRAIAWS